MEFIIILLIGILAYIIYDMVLTKRANKKYRVPAIIKSAYETVLVPVSKLNILSRGYYEDDENDSITVQAMNSLDGNKSIRSIHKNVSVITYDNFIYNGKKYSFQSAPITLSDSVIRNKLETKENVTIYYNPNDITQYHFDLSFIL